MKILKLLINDKVIEEKILKEEGNLIKTKHYEVRKADGFLKCKSEGFKGASIIERGAVKNLLKKIGV